MPMYMSPEDIRAAERIEKAQAYLRRAKRYADEANERYETGPGGRATPVEMATMNALVAIAQMTVPAEADTTPATRPK